MKYTIIIPVYNAEKYLRKCLDSVRLQRVSDWECICVNDGSTDGSLAVLSSYAQSDSRFRIVDQVNSGPSKARNAGLDLALGDWVTFLDSDDFLSLDYLSRMSNLIDQDPDADCFAGNCIIVDGNCVALGPERQLPKLSKRIITNNVLDVVSHDKYRWCLQASCSKVIRRSFLDQWNIRFNIALKNSEDSLFWSECFAFSKKLVVDFSGEYYYYRQVQGSLSRTQNGAEIHRGISVVSESISKAKEYGNAQLRRYAAHMAMSLLAFVRVKSFRGDKVLYLRGLIDDPSFRKLVLGSIVLWADPFYYRLVACALIVLPRAIVFSLLKQLIR